MIIGRRRLDARDDDSRNPWDFRARPQDQGYGYRVATGNGFGPAGAADRKAQALQRSALRRQVTKFFNETIPLGRRTSPEELTVGHSLAPDQSSVATRNMMMGDSGMSI